LFFVFVLKKKSESMPSWSIASVPMKQYPWSSPHRLFIMSPFTANPFEELGNINFVSGHAPSHSVPNCIFDGFTTTTLPIPFNMKFVLEKIS
jgi:hypothetical protein